MQYFVYLIVAKNKNNNFTSYVGYTSDIKKRLILHNSSKGAKFTRGRFWELAYSKIYKTKSIALSEEYKLKKNIKLRNYIKKNFIKK